ncbi:LuxR C-terminal-related transcriptional regulator [Mycobacterium sp. CVI_P3]|uniref:LuxR C-terminal-related transcriptional regulator n=1 Tax=Mycobacterium pinniadriaticum TaxID=2994102 RepID=A0ABT3SI17_9MYCO|nr:helix-turn-helix transcriptional regulator [Mycobacterium pinniadriaticum]MCX2932370.1 LuxR C-terminal-related transcriptional regulator [Mycobacterium pinniadriaticum]MCX2938773.1 LuxR C-terminal-related transcriptional regulator [Mycobacterium pinniadriaticum]
MTSNSDLADRIPVELCEAGFGRVLFSLIRRNTWLVRSAHTTDDTQLAARLLEVGRAHPRRLCRPLPESAMLLTKEPILVDHPLSDPRVNTRLVDVVQSHAYVAAAVHIWETPVALLHADVTTDIGDVGPGDRDVLGVFAEGLGAIMERNIALERVQAFHNGAKTHLRLLDSITNLLAEIPDAPATAGVPDPSPFESPDAEDIAALLTRREVQVLNLLAAGKTNAEIGARLFISEGTVKSHMRHIMEKLGAANRTEAVALYRERTQGHPPSGTET